MTGGSRGSVGEGRTLGPGRRSRTKRRSPRGAQLLALLLLGFLTSAALAAVVLPGRSPGPRPSFTMNFEIAHNTGALAVSQTSIGVAPSGTPWISFYNAAAQDLVVAKKAAGGGCTTGSWSCETVDGAGSCGIPCDAGRRSSIAIAADGVVHLAYENSTSGRLFYANNSLGGWTKTAVASSGQHPSLALGPTGEPVIAFFNSTNTDLYLATRVGVAGSGCLSAE
ncbi:MAG TPA: hypothetical protein VI893_00290, partial [Thermoplasmata archaeon]|nr:hypothetical protein [Thermoplasmata archaeon]